MSGSYHYSRFRWMRPLDLDTAVAELGDDFAAVKRIRPKDDTELTLYGDQRDEVTAYADTLSAALGSYRAILYQRERRPFTEKDLRLRAWVLKNYDKATPTPFPWGGDSEPRYDVEGSTEKTIPP